MLVHEYQCENCDKRFAMKNQLKKHKLLEHEEGKYKCQICRLNCLNEETLLSHIESIHELDKCRLCMKEFKNLENHFAASHLGKKPFQCNRCDKTFSRKPRLKVHNSLNHTYPCKNCHKIFTKMVQLNRHKKVHRMKNKKQK